MVDACNDGPGQRRRRAAPVRRTVERGWQSSAVELFVGTGGRMVQYTEGDLNIIMDSKAPMTASTTIIHRPFGAIAGYRRLFDRASRACVHAFPMIELPRVAAAGLLASAGAYLITDHRTVYIGESSRPARRLGEHAGDSAKAAFAREAFVIAGCEGCAFDKILTLDLQFRLTRSAVDAGMVTVSKGVNPIEPAIGDADRSTHDRIVDDALRLLFDAGCRIFAPPTDAAVVAGEPVQPEEAADSADSGPMEIGVSTTPSGAEEYELQYDGAWARGYRAGEHFVVSAGSEVRTATNGSVNTITRTRREDLFRAGVLAEIPGVPGRRRLIVAVAFSSMSIAAKVVCGAHTTTGKWVALTPSKPVWLAA